MNDKQKDIEKYSNPQVVRKNVDRYLGNDVPLYLSSRKDKKYMIQDPDGKWIHFGQMGFRDFTLTGDENKRRLFRQRNHKWADADYYTPSWLSYNILWD
jgi:hypothetical protein